MSRRLTKSSYLVGRQCGLRQWLRERGVKEPEVESDEVGEMRAEESREVEELAERLFPGARFQVHVQSQDLAAVVDVLEPREAGRAWLWEVKASKHVHAIHQWDLAFQVLVARRGGLALDGCGIVHLREGYVRGDSGVDPAELLVRCDLSARVEVLLPEVEREVGLQLERIARDASPRERPSQRCKAHRESTAGNRPSACGHLEPGGHCRSTLPAHWAGELPGLGGAKARFVAEMPVQDCTLLDPEDPSQAWTKDQARAIRAARSGQPEIDPDALRWFLQRIRWPVAYMDFEFDTSLAIPPLPGYGPYDPLAFQWSVQVQSHPGAALEVRAPFLHMGAGDPSRDFLASLRAALPESGSVVVHHAPAEQRILDLLGRRVGGDLEAWARALKPRLFDTEQFLRAGYYHPDQHGSYSLKRVAGPLLGAGYGDLNVRDGLAAVAAWQRMCACDEGPERERLRADLLAYCGRDSELMHGILIAMQAAAGSDDSREPPR